MGTLNVLYSAAYSRTPPCFLRSHFAVPPMWLGMVQGERGQLSPNLLFSFTNQDTFECNDPPQTPIQIFLCFLPSFLCLVCLTLVAFVTLPHVTPLGMLWSNFPKLLLFFMTFKRSLVILWLLWWLCVPLLSSGGNLENLPKWSWTRTQIAPASPEQTACTGDLRAEPPCNTGMMLISSANG